MIAWDHDTIVFVALTSTAALWMLLHLGLTLRAARDPASPRWLRWLAFLPPLTVILGYRAGAKLRAVSWCIVAVAYLVLRMQV